ncbi:MAG: zinc ribbon domain-containing protein [Desulfurococcaceae archaeon]
MVEFVNPRKTSSTCPRCGSKLKDNGSRVLSCSRCGFTGDRDVIACINLFLRYSRYGVPGVTLKPDENPSGMQGNKNEAMTSTYINSIIRELLKNLCYIKANLYFIYKS